MENDSKMRMEDGEPNPLRMKYKKQRAEAEAPFVHKYCGGAVCETDDAGFATPEGRSPLEIVVDASEGFIPLWAKDVTLRWRFNERSMSVFRDPTAAQDYIRELFARGIALWENAAPVKFSERHDAWDFEITMMAQDNCNQNGCTLARAFFPDGGRHDIAIYPRMFEQSIEEQIETMAHEVGHVFGLRHFFALIAENRWPAEIFGEHSQFSIMNYGPDSRMSENDREDLIALYDAAWDGVLEEINGTPIRLYEPFSAGRFELPSHQIAAIQMG